MKLCSSVGSSNIGNLSQAICLHVIINKFQTNVVSICL